MKPFSPMYFIKANRTKCALLIFMLFLGFAAYLGGLYVTNPDDNWKTAYEYENSYITVANMNSQKYDTFLNELKATGKTEVIDLAGTNGVTWKTIMGFDTGFCGYTFKNAADLKKYFDHVGVSCDYTKLKTGTMVMSKMLAANRGYSVGDKIDHKKEEEVTSGKIFELVELTDQDGYFAYFIDDNNDYHGVSLLLAKNTSKDDLLMTAAKLNTERGALIMLPIEAQISDQYEIMNIIYMFVIILFSVIMAITVNAAFVGTYQRRNFEFAVYRAIGISKKRMIGKLLGELLLMDAFALILGGALFFLFLFLFNNLALAPNGMYLCYFHPLALLGLLVCNVIVMVPLFITRTRQMLKADICEY